MSTEIYRTQEVKLLCSLFDGTFQGNCSFCQNKTDCMLIYLLNSVRNLESVVTKIETTITLLRH